MKTVTPERLLALLEGDGELALLDVREAGLFVQKHLFHASCAPLWRLEYVLDRLVPRRTTPVVLVDLQGEQAAEAAAKLERLGYADVAVLEGGILAWEARGYETFIDTNVPSKAFGEVVEVEAQTPHLDAEDLHRRLQAGEKLVIVDGRPAEEFFNFSLPGAHNVPNGELPYRIREFAPDPQTPIVVNCAGRTRSIIGTQTLKNLQIPNPVVALKGGTMSWLLAGWPLEKGKKTILPEPQPESLAPIRARLQELARHFGITALTAPTTPNAAAQLETWRAAPDRSLYLFDVRTLEEYRAGHLPGARWAAGGQLVQATDTFLATRNARLVLADHDGVRALNTAVWLRQMGFREVFLFPVPPDAALETGPEAIRILPDPSAPAAPWISPQQAESLRQDGAAHFFDIDQSVRFARQHIEGASFAAPHRIESFLDKTDTRPVLLTSEDGVLARIVASQLAARGYPARAILGGTQAWRAAGLPTASGREGILTGEDDTRYSAYELAEDKTAASLVVRDERFRAYLQWELDLVAQIQRPGAPTRFQVFRDQETGIRDQESD
ncbi:MAG: rhodanese-related sulfurtransferase [Zoogloeaceae bacterium]|jgi:rhodanese-related sulfurtransferase|nr:rhodanese-related sulfurtransferase [Zoogloeaceae bacterium]